MNKTIMYLVRHGQTRWNVEKRVQGLKQVPLNKAGKKQALALKRKFQKIGLDRIYTSPALRTRQTAKIIANGMPFTVVTGFSEREMGVLTGLNGVEIKKLIPDIEEQWARDGIDWKPSKWDGETLREFQKRAITAFKNLIKQNKGKRVLVVAHGSVIKSLVHWLHGGKPEDYLHVKEIENAEIVCITINKELKGARITHQK